MQIELPFYHAKRLKVHSHQHTYLLSDLLLACKAEVAALTWLDYLEGQY